MVNGEFERPPANSGLDWRTGSTTYLAVDFPLRRFTMVTGVSG